MIFLYVTSGGAIGAALQYLVSIILLFPFGTLAVNGICSFSIRRAFAILTAKGADRMIVFAVTGVLGGFAMFSAFLLVTFKLLEAGRMVFAGDYVVASVVLSLAAVFSGILLTRGVWG